MNQSNTTNQPSTANQPSTVNQPPPKGKTIKIHRIIRKYIDVLPQSQSQGYYKNLVIASRTENFFFFVFFMYVTYIGMCSRKKWFMLTNSFRKTLQRLLIIFGVPQIGIKMSALQTNMDFYKRNRMFFEKHFTRDQIRKIDFYSY